MNITAVVSYRSRRRVITLLMLICIIASLTGCAGRKQTNGSKLQNNQKQTVVDIPNKGLGLLIDKKLVPLNVPVDSCSILYCRWSPDGQWLVYGNKGDLFLYNYKTGKHINLTKTPDRWELMPAWSPDGQTLCFTSRVLEPLEKHTGSKGVLVMSGAWGGSPSIIKLDGSAYEILEEEMVTDPGWSSDGKTVVYGSEGNIHFFNLKEHKARTLTPSEIGLQAKYIGSPVWSPIRSEIAIFFSRDDKETTHQEIVDGTALPTEQGYLLLDLKTNKIKPLYTFKGFFTPSRPPAVWSADGRQLAINLKQETFIKGEGLIVSNRQGDKVMKIGEAYQVIWEPNGKRLVYMESSNHKKVTLVTFKGDTYTKEAVANKVSDIQGLTWQSKSVTY